MFLENKSNLAIRLLDSQDIKIIAELDQLCFSQAWSEESLLEELNHPDALNLGILPHAVLLTRLIAGERWIFRIMTHPQQRQQGLAKKLLKALPAGDLWLEVRKSNQEAILFYQKLGFQIIAKRLQYYVEEDALIMKR